MHSRLESALCPNLRLRSRDCVLGVLDASVVWASTVWGGAASTLPGCVGASCCGMLPCCIQFDQCQKFGTLVAWPHPSSTERLHVLAHRFISRACSRISGRCALLRCHPGVACSCYSVLWHRFANLVPGCCCKRDAQAGCHHTAQSPVQLRKRQTQTQFYSSRLSWSGNIPGFLRAATRACPFA